MGNKKRQHIIDENYLINGLRQFFYFRKARKEEFDSNSLERSQTYFRKLWERFEIECIPDIQISPKQLEGMFIIFSHKYLRRIDEESEMFNKFAQDCVSYCMAKSDRVSNSRSWHGVGG